METQFTGRPLVEPARDVPQIGFLEGPFGSEFLAEYNGRVERDYRNNKNLRVLSESDGLVVGSNPFAVVLANEVLRGAGLKTATQADLEKALRFEALDLKGTYEDTGLVLRSEADPNEYLARDLATQLKARDSEFKYPVVVNLTDLELRKDADSNYGLAFKLRDDATPIYAPVLNQPSGSRFSSTDVDEVTGLPKQVGEQGDRYLYTRDSGLSRLYLGGSLCLGSGSGVLADSLSDGRVVVVSGVATQKISE